MPLFPVSSGCCSAPDRISVGWQAHHPAPNLKENPTPHLQRQLKILRLAHLKEHDPRALPVKADMGEWERKPTPAHVWYVVRMRNLRMALAVRMKGAGENSMTQNNRRSSFG